ncbi:MAG TPA: MFS transporter, partial [Propionicimonas sp.]
MRVTQQNIEGSFSAWRMVVGLGLVSLTADMVADGGKSLYGPLLGALGASGLVVGLVTGAAEGVSLLLRVVVGPLADRFGNHWNWTIAGYGVTVVCIPLLAVVPFVGAAGLAIATVLILVERVGKAIRSPSKTALLAHAAGAVGRGRGFGVHKTLDLIGAVSGPLLVAAVLAWTGAMWPSMLVLIVPGILTMTLLSWMRRRVPDPSIYDPATGGGAFTGTAPEPVSWWGQALGRGLPAEFFLYAAAVGLTTGGLVSYGIISFHFTKQGLVPIPIVPVVFALGMAAAAIAALANGWLYDRVGPRVLLVLPLLVALVPLLTLGDSLSWALVGILCWGSASGLQDSTIKALVADMVPAARRATAYGVFAAVQGLAALGGGALAGVLYDNSLALILPLVAVSQMVAAALLITVL